MAYTPNGTPAHEDVQTLLTALRIAQKRSAKRRSNLLLDPLERAVSWLVHAVFTPERGKKWAARLGLPGVRRT